MNWTILVKTLRDQIKILFRRSAILIGLFVCLPIAILVILLRPFVLIRFGCLRSDRIGHFSSDTEAYFQERQCSSGPKLIDIIECPYPVCNTQLELMWRRTFFILPRYVLGVKSLERCCRFLTKSDLHSVNWYDRSSQYKLFIDTLPALSFTNEEKSRAKLALRELGIPLDAEWICIHNRDSAYLEATFGGRYAYHDYRDSDIHSMFSAAEELAARGYYVVRVGSIVKSPMCSSNPQIIDYASCSFRNDFLDIYLLAHAKFFLGNDSGIGNVPMIFRRPIAMTNYLLLENFYIKDYEPWLFIPKRIMDPVKGRFLTLREILQAGLGNADKTEVFTAAGVELVSNSSAEILDLAVELDERIKGSWKVDPAEEELQQRFWKIFSEFAEGRHISNRRTRIGSRFLRQNPDFLN